MLSLMIFFPGASRNVIQQGICSGCRTVKPSRRFLGQK
jgi:hypothetical protein